MIRVVHIITGLSTGGAEMMLLRLVEKLQGRFDQHVISLTDAGSVAKKLIAAGVPVTALGMSSTLPNPFLILKLAMQLKRLKPNIVQTWLYHADLIGGVAARLVGVSAIVWNVRNNELSVGKTKALTRKVAHLTACLSRYLPYYIICCSQVAMDTHIALGYQANKFIVIPNGFDLSHFKPDIAAREAVRLALGIAADVPLIGLIARFDPQKNHAGFFTAAGHLHRIRPKINFLLAGRGVDKGNRQLMELIRENNIEDVTHLLGERQDIPTLNAALDIATCVSWSEAFPNVLGEAMACGVPCVSTNAGDAALIIGETGLVVPCGDMPSVVNAWLTLLDMTQVARIALSKRARDRVADNFEMTIIANRYASLYQSMFRNEK